MTKLSKFLQRWQEQGLLYPYQASAISQFEQQHAPHIPLIFRSFLFLGVFVVAMGVIALTAANWDLFPAHVKLITNFSLLFFTAAWIYYFIIILKKNNFWSDSILFFYLLLCLASIGLILQIYNSDIEAYRAILYWTLITFPLLFFVSHSWVIIFWSSILLMVLPFNLFDNSFWPVNYAEDKETIITTIIFSYPLLLLNFFLLLPQQRFLPGLKQTIGFWTICFGISAIAIFDSSLTYPRGYILSLSDLNCFAPAFILGLSALFIHHFTGNRSLSQKILISAIIIIYLLLLKIAPIFSLPSYVGLLFSVFSLSLLAIYLALNQQKIAFHFIVILIMLRFLQFYIDHFSGLLSTGIGFIITGLVIIAAVSLWYYIYRLFNVRFKHNEASHLE